MIEYRINRIKEVLKDKEAATIKQIGDETSFPAGQIRLAIQKGQEDGVFTSIISGVYKLVG